MQHVYDRVIQPFEKKIEVNGAIYTLENKTKMGENTYYTFVCSGRETLLIVPQFAEQYMEVEKFAMRYCFCKKLETCRIHIKREISKFIKVHKLTNSASATGEMYVLSAVYKDIKVNFNYMNNHLTLSPEFEIINNNLFGNGITVNMKPEDKK